MVKRKRTNKDLQNITQKTKDLATWTPLKTRGELMCSGRVRSFCSTCGRRYQDVIIKSSEKTGDKNRKLNMSNRNESPSKAGDELRCSWRVFSFYFTCGTRCVTRGNSRSSVNIINGINRTEGDYDNLNRSWVICERYTA